jgi:hypothetical protein
MVIAGQQARRPGWIVFDFIYVSLVPARWHGLLFTADSQIIYFDFIASESTRYGFL